MDIQENIVNRVAQSGLISFDLAELSPKGERVLYDIKDNLFHGLILREKDFREFVKTHDWSQYAGKHVAVTCTADAIVPTWAYMLLASKMAPHAASIGLFKPFDKHISLHIIADHRFDLLFDLLKRQNAFFPNVGKLGHDELVAGFKHLL